MSAYDVRHTEVLGHREVLVEAALMQSGKLPGNDT